jgi:hypothetical protein
MLLVKDLRRLPEFGFRKNGATSSQGVVWVRDIKILGYEDECVMSLVVNPIGSEYQKNQLIQLVSICDPQDLTDSDQFEADFPADILARMLQAGVIAYVPDNAAEKKVA